MAVGRMGWAAYTRILGAIWAEPMSSEECARRFDRGLQKMRELLWRMERAGLVIVCDWVKSERTVEARHTGMLIPVFCRPMEGRESAPYPRPIARPAHGDTRNLRKPRAEFLAWTNIIEAMRVGATRDEIREETGAAHHRISLLLRVMRECNLVHTADWRRCSGHDGRLCEVVKFGPGRSMRRPAPKPRAQVQAEYLERAKVRRAARRAAKAGPGAMALQMLRRTVVQAQA